MSEAVAEVPVDAQGRRICGAVEDFAGIQAAQVRMGFEGEDDACLFGALGAADQVFGLRLVAGRSRAAAVARQGVAKQADAGMATSAARSM